VPTVFIAVFIAVIWLSAVCKESSKLLINPLASGGRQCLRAIGTSPMESGASLATSQPSSQFRAANTINETASNNTSQSSLDLNDCDTCIYENDQQNNSTSSDGDSTVRDLNAVLEDGSTTYASHTPTERKTCSNKKYVLWNMVSAP